MVDALGTTTTTIFGVGPVVAATVVGITGDARRFSNRDRFAAFNGTAPIEVSSGGRKIHRLSRRGNGQLNHATHMAAVTQIRFRLSPGRAFYDRKNAEGKTSKEALRALERRVSDALYAAMVADAQQTTATVKAGPGGQPENDSVASAAGSHPETPALRPSHFRTRSQDDHAPDRPSQLPTVDLEEGPQGLLTNKEDSICRAAGTQHKPTTPRSPTGSGTIASKCLLTNQEGNR